MYEYGYQESIVLLTHDAVVNLLTDAKYGSSTTLDKIYPNQWESLKNIFLLLKLILSLEICSYEVTLCYFS